MTGLRLEFSVCERLWGDTVLGRVRTWLGWEGECEIMPQVVIYWADTKMKVRSPEHGTVLGLGLSVR